MNRLYCLLCIILLCLTLIGCDPVDSPLNSPEVPENSDFLINPTETDTPNADASDADQTEIIAPEAPKIADIVFTRNEEINDSDNLFTEYAQIDGFDEMGNILWSYTTEAYELTQLQRISEIGRTEDRYYFCEDGTIVALNPETGEVLWKNSEFIGSPAQESARLIDADGTVYLCGYLGPDLFAVDANGNTLCNVSIFSEEYYWPYALKKTGEQIAITFEAGPESNQEDGSYVLYVNLNDFSYSAEP